MPTRPTRKKYPKICFDRILDEAQILEAARRAVEENPANIPLVPISSGAAALPEVAFLALETRTLWAPGRTLRVRFLEGDPVVQAKVQQVAKTWEQHANIVFSFGDDSDAEIRVSFKTNSGSWSYLGTDALGIPTNQATMNYGWLTPTTSNDEYNRVVLHEFGHALGCIHEHQHPANGIPWNRPAVYRAYGGPPNFWSREKVDSNIFQKYSADQTQFSEFDRHSIMLYPIPKELTDGVFEVGLNFALSDLDRSFIGAVYPFDLTPVTELTIGAPATQASIGVHGEEDLFRFRVNTAGRYTIETGGNTDVFMGLYGPDDRLRQIASDDDSGKGLNARISKELQAGTYFVRVRHFRPRSTGAYTLEVYAGTPR